jgi:hypothetical protein
MKFFKKPYTPENLKKQYKILCLKLHPDTAKKNVNPDHFLEMVIEYNLFLNEHQEPKIEKQQITKFKKRPLRPTKIVINKIFVLDLETEINYFLNLFK